MTSFKRARSEEQQAIRRQSILDTAAAMLREMPVARVSLNELSRRVGLAKSNVLRYFESREAVLLELTTSETGAWLADLDELLTAEVAAEATAGERGDQVVATIAASLADRPVLCDLVSTQAAVLEHNVSTEVAARYKRTALGDAARLAGLVRRHLPELDDQAAGRFVAAAMLLGGAVWTHSHPSDAVLAVYRNDPEIAAFRMEFVPALTEGLQVFMTGLLTRSASRM